MKRLTALVLVFAMMFCLQACSAREDEEAPTISAGKLGASASLPLEAKAGNIADLDAGFDRVAVLLTDGTVICVEDYHSGAPVYVELGWTDIVQIDASGTAIVGVTADGKVMAAGHDMADDLGWKNADSGEDYNIQLYDFSEEYALYETTYVTDIAACAGRVVVLFADGTVISSNSNDAVSNWTQIVAVDTMFSSFGNKIFGVRADGTVVEAGTGDDCYTTSGWTDIVDICAGWSSVAGLRSDGSVVISETPATEANMGAVYDTSTWFNIAQLSGLSEMVGLRKDGTVVAAGLNEVGAGNVTTWYDVVDVAAGEYFTVALKKDGTIVGTSMAENWNLSMLYG